jgi:two-component system sensor histidine kinase BaeS
VAAAAAGGGAAIVTDVREPLGAVQGDPDRLEQVFRNLFANAVTHTPHDGVITVRGTADGPRIVIDVIDTGCGIPADHLPHVFDRFYRVDGSRSRATGGAGLGLAIARQLVGAHGGAITASSGGTNAGTCFTVTLPAAG